MMPPTISASRIGTRTRRMVATISRPRSFRDAPCCAICTSAVKSGPRSAATYQNCHPGQATQWRRAGTHADHGCAPLGWALHYLATHGSRVALRLPGMTGGKEAAFSCRLRPCHQQADLTLHVQPVLDYPSEVPLEHHPDAIADLQQLIEIG